MLINVQFGQEIFTYKGSLASKTVDSKKLLSDLFHAGSTLLEVGCFTRKKRPSDWPRNITMALKSFLMQHRITLQCITLTLHCKDPAESLLDQCKFVSEELKKTTESIKL